MMRLMSGLVSGIVSLGIATVLTVSYSTWAYSAGNVSVTVNTPGDGFLALRSEPTTKSGRRLVKIPHGTPIQLGGCQRDQGGNWCQTSYNGFSGWVFDRYVTEIKEEGRKGHWSWSGNMSTTQFGSGMTLNVLYNPKLDCNSAFLILTGNDQITSVGLEIDGNSYDTINVDSKYSDDGTPFVIIGIDNTLINEIKQGQQLSLATNVINLTASLEGSARAFNNSYNNCKLMPQEMVQQADSESNHQHGSTETQQRYVWESHGRLAQIRLLEEKAAVGIVFDKQSSCEQPAFYIAGIPGLQTINISIDQQPLGQLNLQQEISDDGIPFSMVDISDGGIQALSQGDYLTVNFTQGNLNVPLSGIANAFHEAHAFCQNELYQYQLSEQRQAQAYSQDSPTAAVQSFVEGLRQMGDGKELKREMNSGNYGGLDQIFRLGQQMEQNAQNAQRQLERSLGISEAEAQRMGYERVCRDACSSQYAACIKGCGTITNWNCRNACSSNKESCRKRCEM